MGVYLEPGQLPGALRGRRASCSRCSASGASSGPGRSPAASARWWPWVGRSMPTRACCCSTSRRPASRPLFQDEVFIRCRQINAAGVSIVMVEQNARRCLQICHRAYVLDQGTNAYTGTGQDLLTDPKVIELYLGTLARAT